MSNKIFLSCEEANHTCDKTQYNYATLWEKIKLTLHLAYCVACRKYTKNNIKLTHLIKQKSVKLDIKEKTKMQSVLDKELAKQNNN